MQSLAAPVDPTRRARNVHTAEPRRRKADPAPSRWSYRLQRLMLTPAFRFGLRVGLPCALSFGLAASYLGDEARRNEVLAVFADMRASIESRPEFMVNLMAIDGASAEVAAAIHEIVPYSFPVSSFGLDLLQVQELVEGLNPVRSADVHLQPGGVLQVVVDERKTAALWRTHDGLFRLDKDGVYIGLAGTRADFASLPLVSGEGADRAIGEALALQAGAAPLGARLKGFTRMGERRWDVVLDRGQRILLPEKEPVRALERVIALNQVQDVLERDLARVDMRLGHRPTLRLNENAVQELWRIKTTAVEAVADE